MSQIPRNRIHLARGVVAKGFDAALFLDVVTDEKAVFTPTLCLTAPLAGNAIELFLQPLDLTKLGAFSISYEDLATIFVDTDKTEDALPHIIGRANPFSLYIEVVGQDEDRVRIEDLTLSISRNHDAPLRLKLDPIGRAEARTVAATRAFAKMFKLP